MRGLLPVVLEQLERRCLMSAGVSSPLPTHPAEVSRDSSVDLGGRIVRQPVNELLVTRRQGARSEASVLVVNSGTAAAIGSITIALHVSPDSAFRADVPAVGSITIPRVRLAPGQPRVFDVGFTLRVGTTAGAYHLFGFIVGSHGIVDSNLTNNIAGSVAPIVVTNVAIASTRRHHGHLDSELLVCDTGLNPIVDAGLALDTTALAGSDVASNADQADQSSGDVTTQPSTAPSTEPSDNVGSTDSSNSSGGDNGGDASSSSSD